MTAAELYAADPGFRALLRIWTRRRHCPEVLIDYLMDREMYGPAECARWAFTTPKRPVFLPISGERNSGCHPYPMKAESNEYGWILEEELFEARQCAIPSKIVCDPSLVVSESHRYPYLAIVALMDAWIYPAPEVKK